MSQANELNDHEKYDDSQFAEEQNNQHRFVNDGNTAELLDQVNDLAALEGMKSNKKIGY